MKIKAISLCAFIAALTVTSAQDTKDKNELINCVTCIDQSKKWDFTNAKCVDSESPGLLTKILECVTYKTVLFSVSQEITTVENQMQLDGIKNRFRDLPTNIGLSSNMRYVVENKFSNDINMWVSCNNEKTVLLYGTEGESQTTYSKPRQIDCDEKIFVEQNKVGQILIMMRNGEKGNFNLQAEQAAGSAGIIIGIIAGVVVVGGIIGGIIWKKKRDAKLSQALIAN